MTDLNWFESFRKSKDFEAFKKRPIAYFCAEFALDTKIPIYAGGLGVLAGDMIREAADEDFPLIGVGLFYHEGYASQRLDDHNNVIESTVFTKPEDVGLTRVVDEKGQPIQIVLPIQDRKVVVQVW